MSEDQTRWLAPLVAELRAASDSPGQLAEIFEHLKDEVGAEEAGHRWWVAFGATDASQT